MLHDVLLFGSAHGSPAGDFIHGAQAARADTGAIQRADSDAGSGHGMRGVFHRLHRSTVARMLGNEKRAGVATGAFLMLQKL
ncbi:MAG: hypothetical protein ACN6PO_02230, partial [Stenotrophomonas bentonitica]